MNISAQFWGKGCWDFLYSIAYASSSSVSSSDTSLTLEKFIELLGLLQYLLPCDICKQHYKEYIEKNPPSGDLKIWLNNLHNDINKRLEKEPVSLESIDSVIQKHIVVENVTANTVANVVANTSADIVANVTANVIANTSANTVANVTANTSAEIVSNTLANVTANTSAEIVANITANVTANTVANDVANVTANVVDNTVVEQTQKVISEQNKKISPGFQINHPVQKSAPVPTPSPVPAPAPKAVPAPQPAPRAPPPKKKGGCGCGR